MCGWFDLSILAMCWLTMGTLLPYIYVHKIEYDFWRGFLAISYCNKRFQLLQCNKKLPANESNCMTSCERTGKELQISGQFFPFSFFLEKIGYQFSDFVRTVGIRYSWVAFLICTQHTGTFTSLLSEAGWWLIQGSCFQCWVVLFVSKKQTQWWVMVYRLLTRGSDKIKEPVLTPQIDFELEFQFLKMIHVMVKHDFILQVHLAQMYP